LPPIEGSVGNQDGQECDHNDGHRKARDAESIPGRDGLQNPSANEGEGDSVRANHPFAMLLEVPITGREKRSGGGDYPSASLNDNGDDEVEITIIAVAIRQENGKRRRDEDGGDIDAAEHSMKPGSTMANAAGKLKRAAEQRNDPSENVWNDQKGTKQRGIGITLPPSYLEYLAQKFPTVLDRLAHLDPRIGGLPLFRSIGDCILLRFERTELERAER
jgi:hypothetical protein